MNRLPRPLACWWANFGWSIWPSSRATGKLVSCHIQYPYWSSLPELSYQPCLDTDTNSSVRTPRGGYPEALYVKPKGAACPGRANFQTDCS